MSFGQHRITLQPGTWTQICQAGDSNVTVDNYGVGAYQFIHVISGTTAPAEGAPVPNYRTIRPGSQQVMTNLDEGTILWAKAVNDPVVIEVLTG